MATRLGQESSTTGKGNIQFLNPFATRLTSLTPPCELSRNLVTRWGITKDRHYWDVTEIKRILNISPSRVENLAIRTRTAF